MENSKNLKFLGDILKPLDLNTPFKDRQDHIENLLCRSLNMKTVVAFIGAGTSKPLGYPLWDDFAKDMFELLEITLSSKNGDCIAESIVKDANNGSDEIFIKALKKGKVFKGIKSEGFKKYTDRLRKLLERNNLNKGEIKKVSINYNKDEHKVDFTRFKQYLRHKNSKEIDIQTIFSECERMLCSLEKWQLNKQSKFFRILVKSYFECKSAIATKKMKFGEEKWNPYLALLDLPIKKFVTFNYDLEIERALLFKKHILPKAYEDEITCKQIITESREKSFSQKNAHCQELANFYLSRNEEDGAVFHCHGRIENTENCIVSEEDYQKWYLKPTFPTPNSKNSILDISAPISLTP